jgi:hypothetical protein
MKIILALVTLAIASTSLAAVDRTRFDGEYKFVKAEGTSIYNSVTSCSDPVAIGPNTLDARNTKCSFKEIQQNPSQQCGEVLFVRGVESIIRYSQQMDPAQEGPYGSFSRMVDSNEHQGGCDGLNFLVCLAIKHTDLYDERVFVSRPDLVSNYQRNGFNKDLISFQKTEGGLVMGIEKTHYWASGKKRPDVMERANVKCLYKKIAP